MRSCLALQHLPVQIVPRPPLFALQPYAAKGFGEAAPPRHTTKGKKNGKGTSKKKSRTAPITSDQAVHRAVQIAERGRGGSPTTDAEAAKGRLDYVQVKDWGSGRRGDVGSLQVDSTASMRIDPRQPLYEQLARHLELCQVRGDLRPPAGQAPLPPFEKWAFRRRHYVQYLVDLLAVHRALEDATTAALHTPPPEDQEDAQQTEGSSGGGAARDGGGFPQHPTPPLVALRAFSPDNGVFARAGAIAADLDQIAAHSPAAQDGPVLLEAGEHASLYARLLLDTAGAAVDESRDPTGRDSARLQLLAHVYSAHVTHLTTGMRIGAAAADRLDLFPIAATSMYDGYPDGLEDPLQHFIATINQVGGKLSIDEKQHVFAELPVAFRSTSDLLAALAKTH